jgi:hypothetical protein
MTFSLSQFSFEKIKTSNSGQLMLLIFGESYNTQNNVKIKVESKKTNSKYSSFNKYYFKVRSSKLKTEKRLILIG